MNPLDCTDLDFGLPAEIEEILQQHPGVALAGVAGAPDPEKGELVVRVMRATLVALGMGRSSLRNRRPARPA